MDSLLSSKGYVDTGNSLEDALIEYIKTQLGGVIGSEYESPRGDITIITDK